MRYTELLLGLMAGGLTGVFFTQRHYRKTYENIIELVPGVTFENRLLVQAVLTLFPETLSEIQVFVKQRRYRVFKDQGDVKYSEVQT